MVKRIFLLLLSLLLLVSACGCADHAAAPLTRFEGSFLDVFDTVTQIVVYAADQEEAEKLVTLAHDRLLHLHQLYDIYHEYPGLVNLCTLNKRASEGPLPVDSAILELLSYAVQLYEKTSGKVNIAFGSVLSLWHTYREAGIDDPAHAALPPMTELTNAAAHTDIRDLILDASQGTVYFADLLLQLDVGALAKGYAAQQVTDDLREAGASSLLLSVGGNVCAIGRKADGSAWKVGVQDPEPGGYLCTVTLEDASLVTSGTYQRRYTIDGKQYHHIIDPSTLMPSDRYLSVSVLTADSALADGLSTALFNMELAEGQSFVSMLPDVEVFWVLPDGTTVATDGFSALITD